MNLCWIYRKEDNPDLWNGDSPDEYFQFISDVIEYWKQAWDPDIDEEDKEFLDNSVLQPMVIDLMSIYHKRCDKYLRKHVDKITNVDEIDKYLEYIEYVSDAYDAIYNRVFSIDCVWTDVLTDIDDDYKHYDIFNDEILSFSKLENRIDKFGAKCFKRRNELKEIETH